MTKEEFIKQVVTISKYNGDIASYINDNLENVEIPFTWNDSFTGILTKEGEDGYMADKVGQKVRLQFHNLMRFKSPVGAETLPVIDCKLTR